MYVCILCYLMAKLFLLMYLFFQVGRVDCSLMRSECNELNIHKFPTFALFKSGGGHEIHHGWSDLYIKCTLRIFCDIKSHIYDNMIIVFVI